MASAERFVDVSAPFYSFPFRARLWRRPDVGVRAPSICDVLWFRDGLLCVVATDPPDSRLGVDEMHDGRLYNGPGPFIFPVTSIAEVEVLDLDVDPSAPVEGGEV